MSDKSEFEGVIGMLKQVDWLFFDVGSTLVDESRANEHRILDAIKGTIITYDQAYSQAVQLAKQKNAQKTGLGRRYAPSESYFQHH